MTHRVIRLAVFVAALIGAGVPALSASPMAGRKPHRPAGYGFIIRLVGTAVVENSSFRIAVIESGADGRQRTYREGDLANGMRIKQILRNRIVVLTGRGDAVVTMTRSMLSETGRSGRVHAPQAIAHGPRPPETRRHDTRHLDRRAVVSALANLDDTMQTVRIDAVNVYGKPAGVKIAALKSGSIYATIGLKPGDVIQQVNDTSVSLPEQAIAILRQLKEGSDVDIKVKNRRTRWIHLSVD